MTRYRSCWLDPTLSLPSSLENASQKMTGICLSALVAANTPGLFKSRAQMKPMCMCRSTASQEQDAGKACAEILTSFSAASCVPECDCLSVCMSFAQSIPGTLSCMPSSCAQAQVPVKPCSDVVICLLVISISSEKSLDELLTLRDGDVKRIVYCLCLTYVSKFSAAKD